MGFNLNIFIKAEREKSLMKKLLHQNIEFAASLKRRHLHVHLTEICLYKIGKY
jgi:hypothetical protein